MKKINLIALAAMVSIASLVAPGAKADMVAGGEDCYPGAVYRVGPYVSYCSERFNVLGVWLAPLHNVIWGGVDDSCDSNYGGC